MNALLRFYIPTLFIIGRNVRRLTWEGGLNGTAKGVDARNVLEQCLVLHACVLSDWGCKAEYTRTISVALLDWQPFYSNLPGCCFVEEMGEALLSRMVGRQRRNRHVTTWDGTLQLYQTVPISQPTAPGTRGHIRKELAVLVRNRLYRTVMFADSQPFARVLSAQKAVWEKSLPDDLQLPSIPAVDNLNFEPILKRALHQLSTGPPATGDVRQFADANFKSADMDKTRQLRALAEQHLQSWRGRNIGRRSKPSARQSPAVQQQSTSSSAAAVPPAIQPLAFPHQPSPLDDRDDSEDDGRFSPPVDSAGGSLYEPPPTPSQSDDAFSEGYCTSEDEVSLGTAGELVGDQQGQWGVLTDEDMAAYRREFGVLMHICLCRPVPFFFS